MHAEFSGLAQDVVVDVGDVAHTPGLVPAVAQTTLQHVVGDVGGGMTEVRGVVRRDAAGVHGDDGPRLERDDGTTSGVVEAHRFEIGHSFPSVAGPEEVTGDERRTAALTREGFGP